MDLYGQMIQHFMMFHGFGFFMEKPVVLILQALVIMMVEALEDLNSPELSNDTKENELKLSKHHQIRLPDQSLMSK